MDELIEHARGVLKILAQKDITAKAMLEYDECHERVNKVGKYIARNQENKEQGQQIYEFLKSMNNLFDEFIKDLD